MNLCKSSEDMKILTAFCEAHGGLVVGKRTRSFDCPVDRKANRAVANPYAYLSSTITNTLGTSKDRLLDPYQFRQHL